MSNRRRGRPAPAVTHAAAPRSPNAGCRAQSRQHKPQLRRLPHRFSSTQFACHTLELHAALRPRAGARSSGDARPERIAGGFSWDPALRDRRGGCGSWSGAWEHGEQQRASGRARRVPLQHVAAGQRPSHRRASSPAARADRRQQNAQRRRQRQRRSAQLLRSSTCPRLLHSVSARRASCRSPVLESAPAEA